MSKAEARGELHALIASYKQKGSFGPALGSRFSTLYLHALGRLRPEEVDKAFAARLGAGPSQRALDQLERAVAQSVVQRVGERVSEALVEVGGTLATLTSSAKARREFVLGLGAEPRRVTGLQSLGVDERTAGRIARDPARDDHLFLDELRSARRALAEIDYGARLALLKEEVAADLLHDYAPVAGQVFRTHGIHNGSAAARFVGRHVARGAGIQRRNQAYKLAASLVAAAIVNGLTLGAGIVSSALSVATPVATGSPDIYVADARLRQVRVGAGQHIAAADAVDRADEKAARLRRDLVRDMALGLVCTEAGKLLPLQGTPRHSWLAPAKEVAQSTAVGATGALLDP